MALSSAVRRVPRWRLHTDYEYVNVERKTEGTLNDAGEGTITWTAITNGSNVKADIQPVSESYLQFQSGMKAESSHVIFFETGIMVYPGDRVTDASGNIYYINRAQYWRTHLRCYASITARI